MAKTSSWQFHELYIGVIANEIYLCFFVFAHEIAVLLPMKYINYCYIAILTCCFIDIRNVSEEFSLLFSGQPLWFLLSQVEARNLELIPELRDLCSFNKWNMWGFLGEE
jgi:hypothetical protein